MFLLHHIVFVSLATLHYGHSLSAPNMYQRSAHRSLSKHFMGKTHIESEKFDDNGNKFPESCCSSSRVESQDMGRRKVAFSMVGTIMSVGSAFLFPTTANAVYGQDANIALPNVIEGMNNRVTQQCLVESLGNRECLVYLDPENKLYKGADSRVLIERVEKSSEALASIPELIDAKKWLAVIGVLTGPMGTLVGTMDQLSKLSRDSSQSSKLAKQVKTDLYAIAAAADKKQGDKALEYHTAATQHLVEFVKTL